MFLLVTLLHPARCYGRVPAPVLWFGVYLLVYWLVAAAVPGEHAAEALSEFDHGAARGAGAPRSGNLMQDERVATQGDGHARRPPARSGPRCRFSAWARTADAVWTGGERVSALGQNANSAAMILAAGMVALIGLTLDAAAQESDGHARHGRRCGACWPRGAGDRVPGRTRSRSSVECWCLPWRRDTCAAATSERVIALLAISLLAAGRSQLPVMKNRLVDSVRHGKPGGPGATLPGAVDHVPREAGAGLGPGHQHL